MEIQHGAEVCSGSRAVLPAVPPQIRNRPSSESVRGSAPLSLHIEYDANDALDLSEPLPIERKSYFDSAIRRSVDVEEEVRGGELDQAKPEVPGISVGLVRFDVANATIIVLELALNEEVGPRWR
jgi:hypothetical protein